MPPAITITESMSARFWAKVAKSDGCWEWTSSKFPAGYGCFGIGGTCTGAHRVAFVLSGGIIGPDDFICHRCDNRSCVRPDHLFAGSPSDNTQDCKSKGRLRTAVGECAGNTILTPEQVLEAFSSSETGKSLARRMGVNPVTVYDIRSGRTWSHLTGKRYAGRAS